MTNNRDNLANIRVSVNSIFENFFSSNLYNYIIKTTIFDRSDMNIPIKIRIFAPKSQKNQSMHFVLSYDLAATDKRRTEIETQIEQIISPYKYVRKLTTFYIIHITMQSEWDTILSRLAELSKRIPESFHFIMSPTMPSGSRYNGMLNRGDWNDVNNISDL